MLFNIMDDIAAANAAAGRYFFAPETLRYFKSRVHGAVYGGRYFVTSERGPFEVGGDVRRYTVREACDGGADIQDLGGFGRYRTAAEAHRAAAAAARNGGEVPR